ncbi:hypothetical protein DID88_004633 [Monilinia fructigena]|uniref:Uncharacterized protein n=1 Tax=Monilinia fructigena TaxID=38457 RepID=A0A395IRM8_9HELO|nr:hypothetical protein DID88_004633 [Monilinia fructigena]
MFKHGATRLIASKPRTYTPKTLAQTFMKGDWNCPESRKIPAPIGPYSHAMMTPTAVYVSGQLPVDLDGNLVEGTISEKTKTVLHNLSEVLSAAGSSLERRFSRSKFS